MEGYTYAVRRVRVFGKYGLMVRKIYARRRSFTRTDFIFEGLYKFIDRQICVVFRAS
jgi:hypothetical protein